MAVIHVPPNEATGVAQALLAAAEEMGLDPSVVKTSSDGIFGFSFIVPDAVADRTHVMVAEASRKKETEAEEPMPPKKRGRPKKVTAEPVVEEEQ